MFNSTILDVAIGIVFCFASVALFVSAANEGIASLLKLRHTTLLAGIKQLLNDPDGVGLALQLYNHALVNPLLTPADGEALKMPGRASLPAYIPSGDFASALIETLSKVPNDVAALNTAIGDIQDAQLKQLLQGLMARAGGDLGMFRRHVADWFDNAMNRLSGGYKRKAQLWTFVIGLATAVAFNINAFYVLDQLWQKPSLAAVLSSPASAKMIETMAATAAASASAAASAPAAAPSPALLKEWNAALGALPVGWNNGFEWPCNHWQQLTLIFGWLVTASASVFGAPFWFDLLQNLIQVRGTGAKPPADRDKSKPSVTSTAQR